MPHLHYGGLPSLRVNTYRQDDKEQDARALVDGLQTE